MQFIDFQNQSLELTQHLRRISNESFKNLTIANFNAAKVITSMAEEYLEKFEMVHDPATLPTLLGMDEVRDLMDYFIEYQSNISHIIFDGSKKLCAITKVRPIKRLS